MTTTITEVAQRAGVSIKTVSRVLNGEPHVRPAVRERVLQAAKTLAYTPNQAARRLAGSRSFLIAFLYNNPSPSYVAGIQTGAARRCRELGYHLVVEPLEQEVGNELEPLTALVKTLAPDGIILIPPLSDDFGLLAHLATLDVQVVRIAGYIDGPGFKLETPEREGGRLGVEQLLAFGHRRIAIVAAPAGHHAASERLLGYFDAMKAAGIPADPGLVIAGKFDVDSGRDAAQQLLALPDPPTAIFAANDDMALGVARAAREAGLRIPEDLSIVGFDDTPASRTAWPPLTTVRQPLEGLGAAAVQAIVLGDRAFAEECRFELVSRGSVGPARR
ncbi:MAG: LacI family DNA-binding transcriptional regulator [Hyphomonadaceae bacterium]|nr:MAG: LacI family transcriptional regulator [Caulobacteraceae bacterium]MBT9445678.1 LacI family DNA-binding transcriptional regulator [Hyphomonadaceae bacterium]TPW08325.1 MAG: LacI family transcriptional regulator [Alphaproteobacteria bacterium]